MAQMMRATVWTALALLRRVLPDAGSRRAGLPQEAAAAPVCSGADGGAADACLGDWTDWAQAPPAPAPPGPGPAAWTGWQAWVLKQFLWAGDILGRLTFGRWWTPLKAFIFVAAAGALAVVIMVGLDIILRPVVWVGRLVWPVWAYFVGEEDPETDEVTSCRDLEWRGPEGEAVDNDYYRDFVRARAGGKTPNHVVIRVDGELARLSRGRKRVVCAARHGQVYPYSEVVSCSGKKLRQRLEQAKPREVHLCRGAPCGYAAATGVHALLYAGLPAETELDLADPVAARSPLWMCCGWTGRFIYRGWGVLWSGLARRHCRRRRQRAKRSTAGGRELHPDSESEVMEEPCQCEKVHWATTKGLLVSLRGTEPGCSRPAAAGVQLLREDAGASDTSGWDSQDGVVLAPLCKQHRHTYQALRHVKACAYDGCWREQVGGRGGVRLCREHLLAREDEPQATPSQQRAPEPPSPPPLPAPEEESELERLRQQLEQARTDLAAARSEVVPAAAPAAAPAARKRSRSPSASRRLQHPEESAGLAFKVWAPLPPAGRARKPRYVPVRGQGQGAAADTSEGEPRLAVQVPLLEATYSIPLTALGPWDSSRRAHLEWLGAPALVQPMASLPPAEEARLLAAEAGLSDKEVQLLADGARKADHHYARNEDHGPPEEPWDSEPVETAMHGEEDSPAWPSTRPLLDRLVEAEASRRQERAPPAAPSTPYIEMYLEASPGYEPEGAVQAIAGATGDTPKRWRNTSWQSSRA